MTVSGKYPIRRYGPFWLALPANATILAIQVFQQEPQMWVRLDPQQPFVDRRFLVVATGKDIRDDDAKYLGTFQEPPYAWHVLEIDIEVKR